MTTQINHPSRFGTCIAHGPPMEIGLPFTVPKGRPLMMAHPAAGNHYAASFSLIEDAGHPFVHFMVDFGAYFPTFWHTSTTEASDYHRIADTVDGYATFRKATLSTPHWQVHACGDANQILSQTPPVDILYLDWLEWIQCQNGGAKSFISMMSAMAHTVLNNGLVIIDHKHINLQQSGCTWFDFPSESNFSVSETTSLTHQGMIEWLGCNSFGEYTTYSASVFSVHHQDDTNQSKGVKGDDDIQTWFWKTMPEMRMPKQQLKQLLNQHPPEHLHPDGYSYEEWLETMWVKMSAHDHYSFSYFGAQPPVHAWPDGAYIDYLTWIVDECAVSSPSMVSKSYTMKAQPFKLNIVYGDVCELASMLYSPTSVLALRAKLAKQVTSVCPWWRGQCLTVQSAQPWMTNPISGLVWSGPNATPNLIPMFINMVKHAPIGGLDGNLKLKNYNHLVTVAHGTASLCEVMQSIEVYYNDLPHDLSPDPFEVTIVCLDETDYSDTQALPASFQFLPNDGLWGG
jgi:hypothetical protein